MPKMGVRQKAHTLAYMLTSLRKEAPLCSLEVASTDPADPNVYCINYDGHTTWPIGKPENKTLWRYSIESRVGAVSHVPEQIMQGLQQQHERALRSMDDFYRAAVQHLAPQLVMEVLDGKNPSFQQAFDKEIYSFIAALKSGIRDAGAKLMSQDGYAYEACHDLYLHSKLITRLYIHASGTINLNLAPVMTYFVLPQIVGHVALFIVGLNAMTAALHKKQEEFTT